LISLLLEFNNPNEMSGDLVLSELNEYIRTFRLP